MTARREKLKGSSKVSPIHPEGVKVSDKFHTNFSNRHSHVNLMVTPDAKSADHSCGNHRCLYNMILEHQIKRRGTLQIYTLCKSLKYENLWVLNYSAS